MAEVADAQAAVDQLGAALSRAVLVEDPRHRPLWWSAQGQVDATRLRTILQRKVNPEAAAVVTRLGLARAHGPVRTPAVPEAEMDSRWCVPLRARRQLLGYLWVLDTDGATGEDRLPEILACADIAIQALLTEHLTGDRRERRRNSLLARLAAGPDEAAARELVALEELDPAATVSVYAPARSIGWGLRGGMSVHLTPLLQIPATGGTPLPLAQLHVAVARARATAQALRAGAQLARPTWDDLGSWRLIIAAPDDLTVAEVHPGAEVLAAQGRPDLLLTARTLLDRGGDVARTADELHVHRTTLYYRLERIEALTGVNLKMGADRDALHMALRLSAYRLAAGS